MYYKATESLGGFVIQRHSSRRKMETDLGRKNEGSVLNESNKFNATRYKCDF